MSTAVKEKKPFLPQRKAPLQASGGATVALRGAPAGRAGGSAAPSIGGEPRVHLLPLEVSERKNFKALKRRLLVSGAVVLGLVIAGYGLATLSLTDAQSQLAAAQATTSQLLTQQSKYGDVTKVNSDIASILASQKTATANEILWVPLLTKLESTLPAGASLNAASTSIDFPLGTPAASGPAVSVPLEGPRIATAQITVLINQADIPAWLNTLPAIKGYVDSTPNSVSAPTTAGGSLYSLVVTIHLNSDAVSNRFGKTTGGTK
jgi:hypothetical protein